MALDSVYPPDVDLIVDTPGNAAYPDLPGTLQAAVARMNADPAMVQLSVPFTGGLFDVTLSGTDLTGVLLQFLYAIPELPEMIHDAAQGRFDVIESYLATLVAQA